VLANDEHDPDRAGPLAQLRDQTRDRLKGRAGSADDAAGCGRQAASLSLIHYGHESDTLT
jgi:hypothetical protein